ncbi:S-adenosyl-L-methionine-dependent methyltransferase [Pseudovirgaria hyperparasitica]|uniref:tRNA (uracil(54)-C(5))-methyltransferase n=1 Tax=Pseudovirgaria hyperparasitica TaxID=470096 RepID=A0A6A6WI22_9PEZI|nr:S-adenosyl-L-methionine-dependent methyltransferase [Pseudovirgaria hyperparasitica]KAF2761755.1 S-adenosyl-L-methionine-dependent methyltransferase [Pseudovirgaria hyperparasitica]
MHHPKDNAMDILSINSRTKDKRARQAMEEVPLETMMSQEPLVSETEHNAKSLPELKTELSLTVQVISSTGDGLATREEDPGHVYVVPFTAPGDRVKARVFRHTPNNYSMTDFLEVESPSGYRDDSLIKCQYFATCAGCQFQMLPYSYQLAHKQRIVQKAYQNFSNLLPELVPSVDLTMGSPLEYGYRTKLTPHFDGPPNARRSDGRKGRVVEFEEVPNIGFMKKGTRQTIDIEDCPIGTEAVRKGMGRERKRVAEQIKSYRKGATILLRETTERLPKASQTGNTDSKESNDDNETVIVLEDRGEHVHKKSCISDNKGKSKEYIDDFVFVNPAGSFFQNNNSILSPFTQYIREVIKPQNDSGAPITYLVDAYSGSGLFTITLSSLFQRSIGIDISAESINSANTNAKLNNLPESQASFMAADAEHLFAKLDFPASETVMMLDPPRSGCNKPFLRQLLEYGPQRVVYVSCNVHTQARDVGILVGGMKGIDAGLGEGKGIYEIESLKGFDFFPQTGHVEGVAVLRKK